MKRYRWLLILVVLSVACSDAGTTGPDLAMPTGRYSMLSLVAGGLGGAGMADGTGAAARFGFSYGVAVDGAGNLFVADTMNNTIRKVVVATGAVTTLAGTAGMFGSTDGTGAAARFFDPSGVAVDGAGNLFVADRLNHTIRKVVVATGAVTTLAGTTGMSGSTDAIGTAARFNRPYGVALDSSGNLFVADSSNHTIRKVVVATGAVTTLAGTTGMSGSTDATGTAARFNRPYGLALDGTGNLFVADFSNHTIRKVVVATGAVTTLAGTASMSGSTDGMGAAVRFKGPSAVALDGAGNLFVTDSNNHTIRKVAVATGAVTTLAGTAGMSGSTDGTGAVVRFNVPTAAAVDSAGNPACRGLQLHAQEGGGGNGCGHDPGRHCEHDWQYRWHGCRSSLQLPQYSGSGRRGQPICRGFPQPHDPEGCTGNGCGHDACRHRGHVWWHRWHRRCCALQPSNWGGGGRHGATCLSRIPATTRSER
jgi:hypothetical protein